MISQDDIDAFTSADEDVKAAAERLRKSEAARAKRKVVKDIVATKTENEYAKARRARKNKE